VDVDGFGSFEEGMQVNDEQPVAQGSEDDLTQQQADDYTATLPCVPPNGSGQVTVILPEGQKPSDQGWQSSGQPCPSDPDGQGLEPVGIVPEEAQDAPDEQDASTGALGWSGQYDGLYDGFYNGLYGTR